MEAHGGSILDPLLFLFYINNIPNSSRHQDFIICADDMILFNMFEFCISSGDSYQFNTIVDKLQKCDGWVMASRLFLDIKKT